MGRERVKERSSVQNRFRIQGANLTVRLPKELDHPAADQVRKETDKMIGRYYIHTIIFDFTDTVFMDSSGIGMIMGRYKALGMQKDSIGAIHVSEYINKILQLSGLHQVIWIKETGAADIEK